MTESTHRRVPKLRFPEFRGLTVWRALPLNRICTVNPPNKGLPDSFIYIDLESVEKGRLQQKNILQRGKAPSRAQRVLQDNDIIFQIVRPYQKNNLLFRADDLNEYVASTGYAQLRANGSSTYLYYALHANKFVSRVIAKCTGSNYPAINSSDLADILIDTPKLDEQQKIADCLSSLDALIADHSDKLDALKTHKKGLLQQLFPRDGETVPRLRFPEFRGTDEWAIKSLGEICLMQAGQYIRAADIRDIQDESLYPCYGGNGLRGFTASYTHKGIFPLIGRQGALCGNVALAHGQFHATEHAVVATVKENVSTNWLLYNLKILELNQYATGQAQPGLSVKNLNKIDTHIPIEFDEQQKIANCLSALDDRVTAQADKIEALKEHKKGLLQQLFPAMDEAAA